MPLIFDCLPCTIASSERTCDEAVTPGSAASLSPSDARNGSPSLPSITWSAWTCFSIADFVPALIPAPSTATTVTSVSPIMSAAAVEAVRLGWRPAFAPASSPATPPARRAGQPTTRVSGLTRLGASSAMAANRARTPPTSSSATRAVLTPLANIPAVSAASDATRTTAPVLAEWASNLDAGSTEPSRTAAIGGTRVARLAGTMLASSVTPVPTISDVVIVCDAITVPPSGRSTPSAPNRATSPLAMPTPVTMPIADAPRPIIRPSSRTERMTCLREAPSVRSVANSRVR